MPNPQAPLQRSSTGPFTREPNSTQLSHKLPPPKLLLFPRSSNLQNARVPNSKPQLHSPGWKPHPRSFRLLTSQIRDSISSPRSSGSKTARSQLSQAIATGLQQPCSAMDHGHRQRVYGELSQCGLREARRPTGVTSMAFGLGTGVGRYDAGIWILEIPAEREEAASAVPAGQARRCLRETSLSGMVSQRPQMGEVYCKGGMMLLGRAFDFGCLL